MVSLLIVIGTLYSSPSSSPLPVKCTSSIPASVASTTLMHQMKPKVAMPQCESFERAPDAGGKSLPETDAVHAVHPAFSVLCNCRLKAMASKMSCGEKGCVHGTCFFNACWCQPCFIGEHCNSEQKCPPTCPDWKEWSNLVKQKHFRFGHPESEVLHSPQLRSCHRPYGAVAASW